MDCSDGSDTSRSSGSSSSSDAPSSSEVSAASSPAASPRDRPDAAASRPALALSRPGVPRLSLGAAGSLAALPRNGGAPGTARQPTARQPSARQPAAPPPPASARDKPSLVPALALPKATAPAPAAVAAAPAAAAALPQQPPAASQAALLSLDMLSSALTLELPAAGQRQQQQQGGSSGELGASCASRLGVPPERLRFYALTEVAGPHQLPPGCTRAAVEVVDSRFSLTALEQLLAENQQLAATAAAAQQQAQQQAPSGEAAQQLEAQLRQARLENEALRQQLRRSESLRRKGQRALYELHQEFNALSRELMLGSSLGSLELGGGKVAPPLPLPAGRGAGEPLGTPAALTDACLVGHSTPQ